MVYKAQENGTEIHNTISEDPDAQLFLTFTFFLRFAGVAEGSKEEKEKATSMLAGGMGALVGSLNHIERLAAQGKI